jgi:hypothetical protein
MRIQSLVLAAAVGQLCAPAPCQVGPDPTEPRSTVHDDDPPGAGVRTSEACALCHSTSERATAMRDSAERSVAPFDLWQSTMMANAARDPFWRAVMSAEMAATPNAAAHIAGECMKCQMIRYLQELCCNCDP